MRPAFSKLGSKLRRQCMQVPGTGIGAVKLTSESIRLNFVRLMREEIGTHQ